MNKEPDVFFRIGVHKVGIWTDPEDDFIYDVCAWYDSNTNRYKYDRNISKLINNSLEATKITRSEFFNL